MNIVGEVCGIKIYYLAANEMVLTGDTADAFARFIGAVSTLRYDTALDTKELGTTPNTGSPKLLAYLDNAAESIRLGNISLAELNINEARKQLRANA